MMKNRLHIALRGAVQGVGFRPFIYRLARELGLRGWVSNSPDGVLIEVEGTQQILEQFILRLQREKPRHSSIQSLESSVLDPAGYSTFEIRKSKRSGEISTLVLPDIAACDECVKEIFNPFDRRYLYPFTNCTHCGPRFSIIESLPYDRANTSMARFTMCRACREEYNDPLNRRFHAQPNACPRCGPQLELWSEKGLPLAHGYDTVSHAVSAIRAGKIVALKGIGGFQLIVDARNDDAINRLRSRKHREEKPLALMYPTLDAVKEDCEVGELEERLLCSPESPIVLLRRRIETKPGVALSSSVAPANPYLGIMLPYSPLHHLLMREVGIPLVATSGNVSDEPICIDELEALGRLGGVADAFLVHNRPIVRHVDDSVVRAMMGREIVLRRARGYAPLPISAAEPCSRNMPDLLAVGAHLKNTVAITAGGNIFLSQHIGDLETKESYAAFEHVIKSFGTLYCTRPARIISDLHPNYLSTQFASRSGLPLLQVQHHYAHVASCMAENQLDGEVLGISWDGTGFGPDRTIWGGEFLLTNETSYSRVATFRVFPLPGGEQAIHEPRRTALGLLYELFGDRAFGMPGIASIQSFTSGDKTVLRTMLDKSINTTLTSSVGRLFDGVASLVGLRQKVAFEGQAAMELEFAAEQTKTDDRYDYRVQNRRSGPHAYSERLRIVDWSPIIRGILDDLGNRLTPQLIAAKFHNTLVDIIVEICREMARQRIVLSGGCFQNRYLTERTVQRLRVEGFQPYWHQRVPPNDGGISLGQMYAYVRQQNVKRKVQSFVEETA
jgi:hydrogenase maturation protein HypF